MQRLLTFLFFILLVMPCAAQDHFSKGYWDTGFWKKCLKNGADSNAAHVHHYKNGVVKHRGAFENGTPSGIWYHYNAKGEKTAEAEFTGSYRYWVNGCLSRKGAYKKGNRSGNWTEYYYENYGECDSVIYYCTYSFEEQTEKWLNYQCAGSEEEYLVAPYYFNRDLDYYNRQFTEIYAGVTYMNLSLLNEILPEGESFESQRLWTGLGQTFLWPAFTANEIRMEYHYMAPQLIDPPDSSFFKLGGFRVVTAITRDLFNRSSLFDVYPVAGLGFGRMKMDISKGNEIVTYHKPALFLNLMFEAKLNLKMDFWQRGISLGVKGGYLSDITGKTWYGEGEKHKSMKSKLSGFNAAGVIGIFY